MARPVVALVPAAVAMAATPAPDDVVVVVAPAPVVIPVVAAALVVRAVVVGFRLAPLRFCPFPVLLVLVLPALALSFWAPLVDGVRLPLALLS